jgi:hypothetical protein
MSIEYYLYYKKRLENIIKYLEEINNENELIFSSIATLEFDIAENIIQKFNLIENRENFKCKLNNMNRLKQMCECDIYKLCDHEFEEDIIDITPERSEKITYCKICEYTK